MATKTVEAVLERETAVFIDIPSNAVRIRVQFRYWRGRGEPEYSFGFLDTQGELIPPARGDQERIEEALKADEESRGDAEPYDALHLVRTEVGPQPPGTRHSLRSPRLSVQPEHTFSFVCVNCGNPNSTPSWSCQQTGGYCVPKERSG